MVLVSIKKQNLKFAVPRSSLGLKVSASEYFEAASLNKASASSPFLVIACNCSERPWRRALITDSESVPTAEIPNYVKHDNQQVLCGDRQSTSG